MKGNILTYLVLAVVVLAVYISLQGANSLSRWRGYNGEDCVDTTATAYTCCKPFTVILGPYTLVANKCFDCYYGGEGHGPYCGDPYFTSLASIDVDGEQPVNPKTQNYAKDLIGRGLVMLNEETQEGGELDSKAYNNAKALIERGLQELSAGKDKGKTDLSIEKKADLLISSILTDQDNQIISRNNAKDNAGILIDRGISEKNDTTINATSEQKKVTLGENSGTPGMTK